MKSNHAGVSLSVIVCTHNRCNLLKMCLAGLGRQTLSADRFEVVIVDNNSTDATREEVTRATAGWPNVRYVFEQQQGVGHAMNRGVAESSSRHLAFIDDDAIAPPDWCEEILRTFNDRPDAAAVGGRILPRYEKPAPRWFCDQLEVRSWGETSRYLSGVEARFGFSGANMAITLEAYELVNGFRPELGKRASFPGYGVETDFFVRLRDHHGLPIYYNTNLFVKHRVSPLNYRLAVRLRRSYYHGLGYACWETGATTGRRFVVVHAKLLLLLFVTPYRIYREHTVDDVGWMAAVVISMHRLSHMLGRLVGRYVRSRSHITRIQPNGS